jgi:hypothetical protein
VFQCEPTLGVFEAVAAAARPLMPVGGSIVAVDAPDTRVDEFVRAHEGEFAAERIRLVAAGVVDALEAGAPGLA